MRLPGTSVRRERDHALIRAVQLETRLQEAIEQRDQLRRQLDEARQVLTRVVDNALFAAGCSPVFEPGAERFRPRTVERQQDEAARLEARPPLSPAAWRRQVEIMDREAAARDQKARLREELHKVADEARRKGAANGGNGA